MTGITTAHTAVVGATTAIVPIARARYSSPTPTLPAMPATAPQNQSDRDGDALRQQGKHEQKHDKPGRLRPDDHGHGAGTARGHAAKEIGGPIEGGRRDGEQVGHEGSGRLSPRGAAAVG